jgi:hypothetical protein
MTTLHGFEVKVGDKVFDIRHGWAEVIQLRDGALYEIVTNNSSYTDDGKYSSDDELPTLFWREPILPKEAFIPLPDLEEEAEW